jgi:uncharacterized surface protein with fasciclin (FAS1) repeats
MKHPMTRILSGIALIVGFALSAVAMADQHGMKKEPAADIIDVAVSVGQFKTLAAALDAADLVEPLKGDGPFTVFAPTDAAFEKLPAGTVESLLKPENIDQLVAILTYHVLPGNIMAADVVMLESATTVNGANVQIAAAEGSVKIDDATVVITDIVASNGVIHVIDSVIIPD